ncbi:trimeric intracellular cation channel family protein [Microbulbifer sp. 2205BS26-8]|uniref:trimeric intracellular cation channel family protein n=1 Tax=Microbulbifer sp. 2205BS26-8 TaxID=3064386 RepID=UPI00273E751B|nr:trimeric intracellular cation channel family protein [Microbulbifer sp. 2205BS26-8]MDP5208894.1 trimeric intracellular cation channel family protein [Microbulbifer sp. 2205BS26-8]
MDQLLYGFDLIGIVVFAFSGVLAAGHKQMDLFGAVVLACVTATGGGTTRDIILNLPVFWLQDTYYLWIAATTGVLSFYLIRYLQVPMRLLMLADAIGLAVFVVIGTQKALELGYSATIAIVMGVMTGTVGGVIRDLLCGDIPLLLRREIYATAALSGASVLVFLGASDKLAGDLIVAIAMLVTLSIRLAALRWNLSAPIARVGHR